MSTENGHSASPKDPQRYITERSSGAVMVTLAHAELRLAFDIALARQKTNVERHAKHVVRDTRDGLGGHIKGAVGEIAASLYFDRPIHALATLGDYDAPDLPPNIQVRTGGWAQSPLFLYEKDEKQHPFILAIWNTDLSLEAVTLVGWAYMKDVARPAYWNPNKAEWAIPAAELRPMAELKAFAAEQRALEDLDRVAKYKALVSERVRKAQVQPQPKPVPIAPSQQDQPPPEPNPLESDF